jgi:hypothetical protein
MTHDARKPELRRKTKARQSLLVNGYVIRPVRHRVSAHCNSLLTTASRSAYGWVNCCWSSPVPPTLVLGPVLTHDHNFALFINFYVLWYGASSPTTGGSEYYWQLPFYWRDSSGISLTGPSFPPRAHSYHSWLTDWLLNLDWPSLAQWFLVPSSMVLMTIFYSVKALEAF